MDLVVEFCFYFRFEIAIFVLIFLNMLSMGIEHYNQHRAVFFVLQVSNAFFTTVFALGKALENVNTKKLSSCDVFFFLNCRSFSENDRVEVSLLYCAVERVRFFVGIGIDFGYINGRRDDRFSRISNTAASRQSV